MADQLMPDAPSTAGRILLTAAGFRAREAELERLRAAGNDEYLATPEDEAIIDPRIASRLVGSHEAQEPGDVSIGSPVGQALFGRRAGDTVAVARRGERTRMLRIASVSSGGAHRPPTAL